MGGAEVLVDGGALRKSATKMRLRHLADVGEDRFRLARTFVPQAHPDKSIRAALRWSVLPRRG